MEHGIKFGLPEEWEDFNRRNQKFVDHFPRLREAFDKHLVRTAADTTPEGRVILLMGRLCLEDFMEIMLLAGNGYGIGALKLVRGLYERAVTISYLVISPGRTDDFLEYAKVERFKAVEAWIRANPSDLAAKALLIDVKASRDEVIHRFGGSTWSGIDFVQLAIGTGGLGQMVVGAYYQPLAHAHATARAFVSRLEHSEERGFEFVAAAQRYEADEALKLAHKIMLYVLGSQMDHFDPGGTDDKLQQCLDDYVAIWKKDDLPGVTSI